MILRQHHANTYKRQERQLTILAYNLKLIGFSTQ